jgi:hypothetical protein
VVLEHRSAQVLDSDFLRDLLPDLSPQVLESVLRRASYANLQEQEAELLASLLLARLVPAAEVPPDAAVRSARDRLGRSLEFPVPPA